MKTFKPAVIATALSIAAAGCAYTAEMIRLDTTPRTAVAPDAVQVYLHGQQPALDPATHIVVAQFRLDGGSAASWDTFIKKARIQTGQLGANIAIVSPGVVSAGAQAILFNSGSVTNAYVWDNQFPSMVVYAVARR